jgi:hypothetical protein
MAVLPKPGLAVLFEVVTGPVVEDEKQLPTRLLYELLEEQQGTCRR